VGSISINGTTYNDVTQAWTGGGATAIAGTYYALDVLGAEPCFTPVIYDDREIYYPGLNWTGSKRFGARKAILYIDLIVFATLANLRANVKSLHASLATNTRYTISINSTDFQGCKLDTSSTGRGTRLNYGGGIIGERIPYVFKQLSDQN
jgi:hypothetical protein